MTIIEEKAMFFFLIFRFAKIPKRYKYQPIERKTSF